jgi:hypothetical protein
MADPITFWIIIGNTTAERRKKYRAQRQDYERERAEASSKDALQQLPDSAEVYFSRVLAGWLMRGESVAKPCGDFRHLEGTLDEFQDAYREACGDLVEAVQFNQSRHDREVARSKQSVGPADPEFRDFLARVTARPKNLWKWMGNAPPDAATNGKAA